MTLREKMISSGVNPEDMGNWCSDLYVKVTPESTTIIDDYESKCNVKTFLNSIDGSLWYDIPFAYTEYYDKKIVY